MLLDKTLNRPIRHDGDTEALCTANGYVGLLAPGGGRSSIPDVGAHWY